MEHGARARSRLIVFVDFEVVEADEPVLVVPLAGRNRHVLKVRAVAREEFDVLCAAAQIAGRIFPLGVLHRARARGEAELHARAGEARALAGDVRVPGSRHFIRLLAVADAVGRDHGAAASHFCVADQIELVVGAAFNPVRVDDADGIFARVRPRGIEPGNGFKIKPQSA